MYLPPQLGFLGRRFRAPSGAIPSFGGGRWFAAEQRRRVVISIAGVGLVAYLLWRVGANDVMASFRVLSWRVLLVVFLPAALLKVADARAWSALLPPKKVALFPLLRAIVAGQAVAALTPTGTFGGDAVKVLMLRHRLARRDAIASLIVAETTSTASQGIFLLLGLVVASRLTDVALPLVRIMWWLVLLETLAIAAFILLQLRGVAARAERLLARFRLSRSFLPEAAAHLDDSLATFYRQHRRRIVWSFAWHLLGWFLGAVEVAVILSLSGMPVPGSTAFVIEALGTGISFATFFMPVQWGIDEGGAVAVFTALGLNPASGLALSLIRRVREATWIAIGLTLLTIAPQMFRTEPAPETH